MNLTQRCSKIRLLLCDVDGVLTDGGIMIDNDGVESKRFHTRDGMALVLWQMAGHELGWISARTSKIVAQRAAELKVPWVKQGVGDKREAARAIMREVSVTADQTCYIGDDFPDLGILTDVGLGVAVADAASELRDAAHHVTVCPGGQGAVRETIEMILQTQQRWNELVSRFR